MMRSTSFGPLALAAAMLCGPALVACRGDDGLSDADAEQAILATFEQINRVPRCSKDEANISAWLVDWARARKFPVTSDAMKNVVITVPATPGWEERPGVVLQTHMDMVCVKTETSTHDFAQDSIPVIRDGDWVHSKDTTLGADDGIGIAIALTIAEKATRPHPRLEILLTTDEEKDMSGAGGLSATVLKGKRMINLDSEDDTVVTLGAAGGVHTDVSLPLPMTPLSPEQQAFVLKVSGLIGGHSGLDVDKHRANANVLVAQLLTGTVPFRLVGMNGGAVDNAITTSSQASLAVASGDVAELQKRVTDFAASVKAQYPYETGMAITLAAMANTLQLAASAGDSAKALALIGAISQGVTAWSTEFAGLPGNYSAPPT